MHSKSDDDEPTTIQFPGAVTSPKQSSVAQMYEESRQVASRVCLPIIGDKFSPLNRRINEADTMELLEAAEEVYLGNCTRLVIKETARYEEAYTRLVESYQPALASSDPQLVRLRAERDKAMAALLKTREKLARIHRLEALAEKTNGDLEQARTDQSRRACVV